MNNIEVLVLHGSPGSGKTTLAEAMADKLRMGNLANAIIDPDDLRKVYPHQGPLFSIHNLAAIWKNFATIPDLKVIIPTVIVDEENLAQLRKAMPAAKFVVCELVAPETVLKARVTAREPNEYWQQRLRDFVDLYHRRDDHQRIADFQVATYDRSIDSAAEEAIEKAGWQTPK